MPQSGWIRKIREQMDEMGIGRKGNGVDEDGQEPQEGEFIEEGGNGDGGLPAPSSYLPTRPPQSEKIIDTLVGIDELPEEKRKHLWLFESKNTRHAQFTNITGDDLPWLRKYVDDIQVVGHWDMPEYSHDLQVRMFVDMLFRKSRSDLRDGMRERPMWIANIMKYVMEQAGPKPPRDSAGWFGMFNRGQQKRY
jgi:hypothetical protein